MADGIEDHEVDDLDANRSPAGCAGEDRRAQRYSAVLENVAKALGVDKTVFYNDHLGNDHRPDHGHDRRSNQSNSDILALVTLFAQVRGSDGRRRCMEALTREVSDSKNDGATIAIV